MQEMMQAMQLQYAAGPQNSHQDYGSCGCHGGHANYCGQGGRGVQCRGNWRGGRVGRVNRDLTHYCWNHVICAHPSKGFRTLAEGQNKDAMWYNKISEVRGTAPDMLGRYLQAKLM